MCNSSHKSTSKEITVGSDSIFSPKNCAKQNKTENSTRSKLWFVKLNLFFVMDHLTTSVTSGGSK